MLVLGVPIIFSAFLSFKLHETKEHHLPETKDVSENLRILNVDHEQDLLRTNASEEQNTSEIETNQA